MTALAPTISSALNLDEAVAIALRSDPVVSTHLATSRAYQQESIAADDLPDPKLRLGMFNVPVDSLDVEENPTTQLRVGVQQTFPRGDTLDLKAEHNLLRSASSDAQAEDSRRKLLRDVRETFLNLYHQNQALGIIDDSRTLFTNLVKITEDQYASGRATQQDVISASLELSRLDDRLTEIRSKEERHRAQLAQWIGETAWEPVDSNFPTLSSPNHSEINQLITQHPLILARTNEVNAARKMIDVAKQDYSPGYNAFFEYRKRFGEDPGGIERDDMLAAMVTIDIPLFPADRQDRKVEASEERANAARYSRDDELRRLKKMYDENRVRYDRAKEREKLYRDVLLSSASDNANAALNGYQSGVTDFTTLMRARITELEVRLSDLSVRIEKATAQTHLLYVTGE